MDSEIIGTVSKWKPADLLEKPCAFRFELHGLYVAGLAEFRITNGPEGLLGISLFAQMGASPGRFLRFHCHLPQFCMDVTEATGDVEIPFRLVCGRSH